MSEWWIHSRFKQFHKQILHITKNNTASALRLIICHDRLGSLGPPIIDKKGEEEKSQAGC